MSNPYAAANRLKKVVAITDYAQREHITAEMLECADDATWRKLSDAVGIHPASLRTRAAVLARLRELQTAWPPEADVVINGVGLTVGQSLTLRVALGTFAMSLEESLGDDLHGVAMTELYRARIKEIHELIFRRTATVEGKEPDALRS